jgi:hypothetical protein
MLRGLILIDALSSAWWMKEKRRKEKKKEREKQQVGGGSQGQMHLVGWAVGHSY